jgi:8-oxo-dGTP diphosphatase
MKTLLLKLWRALPNSYFLRRNLVWLITQKFLVGVVGIVFNDEKEILLLNHSYRKEYPWGLPGGWLKKGEQPHQAIRREIAEEIGVTVQVVKPLIIESDTKWARLDLIFLCAIIDGEITSSDEVLSAKFFPVEKLPKILPSQGTIIQEAVKSL